MYTRLQPILHVFDLEAEKDFYLKLGFTVTYESEDFAAISFGEGILFGLQRKQDSDPSLFEQQAVWQIGADSIEAVHQICQRENLDVIASPSPQEWGEWVLKVRSPNGYAVLFEGPGT